MTDRLPSTRGIEAFLTTAGALNLRLAAKTLNISISAVSRRIIALEDELGVQLFVRSARKLALTPAGVRYRDQLLPSVEIVRQATRAISGQDRDEIEILALPSFLSGWLVPRIGRFLDLYHGASVSFTSLRRHKLGTPDIVIEPFFSETPPAEAEKLFSWIGAPVGRPELFDRQAVREPRDLVRTHLIDLDPPIGGWDRWLEMTGIEPSSMPLRMRFDSFQLAMAAALHGSGVAMAPLFHHRPEDPLILPFQIATAAPGGIYVRRPAGYERPLVRLFRQWLDEEVRHSRQQLPDWARASTGLDY